MFELDEELIHEFRSESADHLNDLERDLTALVQEQPALDADRMHRIFRAVHSIKGGAGLFDLTQIVTLSHQMEEVLILLRSGQMVPNPHLVKVLLSATDRLRLLVEGPNHPRQIVIDDVLADLAALCPTPSAPSQGAGSQLRALLVEDDFASRLLLQTFLSRYGQCHIAVNGREAVDAVSLALEQGQHYHLICMDIMMPEMDGREAVHHIRNLESSRGILSSSGAKIVMTTTVDDVRAVSQCFTELCDAYLMKPIDLNELFSLMKAYQLAT